MAKDKTPAPQAENPAEGTVAPVEATRTPAKDKPPRREAEYSAAELAASAGAFGAGVAPECIVAAFRVAGITKATKSAAQKIISDFMKKEVK